MCSRTDEGDWSVISSVLCITFFEGRTDLGTTRLCLKLACFDEAFKNGLYNGRNFLFEEYNVNDCMLYYLLF